MSQSFLTLKKKLFSNHLKYELFSFYYQSIYLGRLYRYQYLVEFRYFFTSKTISYLSLPAHHIALFTKKQLFSTLKFLLEKLFGGVFFQVKRVKNPQFSFSSQNLSIEHNFFKRDGKVTKIGHLLFHSIWKNVLTVG